MEDLLKQEAAPSEAGTSHSRICRSLAEVLADPGAASLLLQFLRPRRAAPMLLFWMEAARLGGRPPPWPSPISPAPDDLREAALAIFERFFTPSAPEPVAAPEGLVEAVGTVVRRKERPPKQIFQPLQEHVFQIMQNEYELSRIILESTIKRRIFFQTL